MARFLAGVICMHSSQVAHGNIVLKSCICQSTLVALHCPSDRDFPTVLTTADQPDRGVKASANTEPLSKQWNPWLKKGLSVP